MWSEWRSLTTNDSKREGGRTRRMWEGSYKGSERDHLLSGAYLHTTA